jgi:8-oxo-dGTP diphosphatase
MTTDTDQEIARLAADVVLFGESGGQVHVLLIRRGWEPFKDHWALPGGHVDTGEDTAAAAARELVEETGLMAGELHLVAVYADPRRDPRGRYVTFAYTARSAHTPQPTAGDDAADATWLPVTDVLSGRYRLAFDHARLVDDALRFTI